MTEQLHEQIKQLLEANGPMGVNAIQKEVGIPLSTLQKYLDYKQTYFKKNAQRKWDLPENVAASEVADTSNHYATVIESQIIGINASFEMLSGQIRSTLALMSAHKPNPLPVASKVKPIDPGLSKYGEEIAVIVNVIKHKKADIPEEYQKLLTNVNWVELAIDRGRIYVRDNISDRIADLVLKSTDTLPEEVYTVLEEYQK